MSEKLKPCPLCGSTNINCFAEYDGDSYENEPVYRAAVWCLGCHEEGCDPSYDEEPCFGIEAYFPGSHPLIKYCEGPSDCELALGQHMAEKWNRRSGSTCEQRRTRRTCHVEFSHMETEYGDYAYLEVELSCGHAFTWDDGTPPDYCPYCGAKVVSK